MKNILVWLEKLALRKRKTITVMLILMWLETAALIGIVVYRLMLK